MAEILPHSLVNMSFVAHLLLLSLILIIDNFTGYVIINTTITKPASTKLHIKQIPFRKTVSGILITM